MWPNNGEINPLNYFEIIQSIKFPDHHQQHQESNVYKTHLYTLIDRQFLVGVLVLLVAAVFLGAFLVIVYSYFTSVVD